MFYVYTNNLWWLNIAPTNQPVDLVPVYGPPQIGLAANSVFYLEYYSSSNSFTAYKLSNGYSGGSGNGVNGQVYCLALAGNGDLYVGGTFTKAGGFNYSSGIGFYGYEYGWNTTYIFSAFNDGVYSFAWVNGNKLECQGHALTPTVNLSQGDFDGTDVTFQNSVGYFNLDNGGFGMYDYWSAN